MLQDLLIIDNIFDFPDEIVDYSNNLQYYTVNEHPSVAPGTGYRGLRSLSINVINPCLYKELIDSIVNKTITQASARQIKFQYKIECFFQKISKQYPFDPSWIHSDIKTILAGVVYLNKYGEYPGTRLYIDGKETTVENKYNRLVLYNGNIPHAPLGGHGENFLNSRLTFNFFVTGLAFSLK